MKQNRSRRFLRSEILVEGRGLSLLAVVAAFVGVACLLSARLLVGERAPHVPKHMVSDWSHRHVLFPDSTDEAVLARYRKDPRWEQSWYLRHPEAWWPEYRLEREHERRQPEEEIHRDWSFALGASPSSSVINFSFTVTGSGTTATAYGSVNVTDQGNGSWLATSGTLTVTGGPDLGTWTLFAGGPGVTTSPLGSFVFDDLIYPGNNSPTNAALDVDGLLFRIGTKELNVWGNSAGNYSFYDSTARGVYGTRLAGTGAFKVQTSPGAVQSTPAKYTFDVVGTPSCANDFIAAGIAATPSGAQANLVGLNNLYSTSPASAAPNCTTNGPTVKFAYESGTGQIPSSIAVSLNGTQLAYVENLSTGKSLFHVLTIGTTGSNGTSASAPVVPGTGNNAVDRTVVLSPDGGTTNQSSTTAPFISYTDLDANDTAYVTTYSNAGTGSGYLYKIGNVFNGSAPTILWSAAITAIPSAPVYNTATDAVFFTDSNGRIDYVVDTGASPTVTYGSTVAAGTTSLNPVTIDNASKYLYATFNTNGTNAIVVQALNTLASSVSVAVGTGNTTYGGPYDVEFDNAWYTGGAGPLMYVVGTGSGTTPTLYSVGFGAGGLMNGTTTGSAALVSAAGADASPLTEFDNATLAKDFLFVSVTNHCVATTGGGAAGCVMSLNITAGFPTVSAATTAIAAGGGSTEIVIDNDDNAVPSITQSASVYYGTKTGNTLVKATQNALQ
jgi:hypothetical protein